MNGKNTDLPYLALPRGAQWRPVSSVEMSIGDPLEAAGRILISRMFH